MRLDISGMECYDQQRCIDAENSGFHDFES